MKKDMLTWIDTFTTALPRKVAPKNSEKGIKK